jgi:hypothetical protein
MRKFILRSDPPTPAPDESKMPLARGHDFRSWIEVPIRDLEPQIQDGATDGPRLY